MTHSELVELGMNWLRKPYANMANHGHSGCGVIVSEICAATWGGEQPDVLGFSGKKTILIECKTSLADFRRDKDKPFRLMPNMGDGSQR
jgi:hypothetical protein